MMVVGLFWRRGFGVTIARMTSDQPHGPGSAAPHRPRVVITETLDDVPARWLADRCDVAWARAEEARPLDDLLASAEGLVVRTYTQVNRALLARAPRLRVVGRAGVGLDNVDVAACRARGVEVVYTPDANTQAVVEYVLALILDALRPRESFDAPIPAERFHEMRRRLVGPQLDGLKLGILGLGRIGQRLGRAAAALGVRVLANDLLPEDGLRAAVAGHPLGPYPLEFVRADVLYRESDVLSLHVDGRPGNRAMVNEQVLAGLKPSCLLINAARGMLIDAPALGRWARSEAVRTAGGRAVLDVHEPEPPPGPGADAAIYPLFGLPNVRLLPHLASRTPEALENMSWVVRDVAAVLEGRAARYPAP